MHLTINIIVCLFLIGCNKPSADKLSEVPLRDAIALRVPNEESKDIIKIDTIHINDTIYITKYINKYINVPAETIYIAKKVKIKNNNNPDNSEVIKLKDAVLVRNSQIDSLNILLGKKCVGEQTNNGNKWWLWLLIGIVIGSGAYQLIRTLFTKKL